MKQITIGLFCILLAGTTVRSQTTRTAAAAEAAMQMVQPALAKATHNLNLRISTLAELVPSLKVQDSKPDTTWEQMLADADQLYPSDNARRAVFLAKSLKKGDPADRLKDLKLSDSGGRSGSGPANIHSGLLSLIQGSVHLRIQYWIDDDTRLLNGPVRISVADASVDGDLYSYLSFNSDLRLDAYEYIIPVLGGDDIHLRGESFNHDHYYILRVDKTGHMKSEDVALPSTDPVETGKP